MHLLILNNGEKSSSKVKTDPLNFLVNTVLIATVFTTKFNGSEVRVETYIKVKGGREGGGVNF